MDLCDIQQIKALLSRHGFHFSKSMGQNFLVEDWVPRDIAEASGASPSCGVLEVGPGIGTLTIALLKHAASVIAIERDPDLPAVLADTLHPWREKFALIEKDALDVTRDDIVSVASTMVEPGGDAGCLDRASSAANETAQWAVSQSEDCLSESEYRAAATDEEMHCPHPTECPRFVNAPRHSGFRWRGGRETRGAPSRSPFHPRPTVV